MSLPDKPSELIRLAIKDLTQAENNELYRVEMGTWHYACYADGDGTPPKCEVCLAGSIMAFSLGAPINKDFEPADYKDDDTRRKLYAIDDFREGSIEDGLRKLELEKPELLVENLWVTEYEDDPEAFKKEMLEIANALQYFGL